MDYNKRVSLVLIDVAIPMAKIELLCYVFKFLAERTKQSTK